MMVDNSSYEARSLIHRRETVKFVTNVGLGARQTLDARFTREVVWLRSEETTWRASLDGTVLKEGGTWNDFYGPGTSAKEAIEHAASWREKFPAMAVEVETKLRLFPALLTGEKAFYHRALKYCAVPSGWFVDDDAFAAWRAKKFDGWWGDNGVRRLEPEITTIIVWRDGVMTPEGETLAAQLAADFAAMKALPDERVDA